MAKWKKAEEGYFADSFNRDSTYACADAGISSISTIALNNCTYNDWDGIASLEGCLTANNTITAAKVDASVSFTNSIIELQEKIKALELAIKQQQTKVLRHYQRSDFLTLGG